MKHYLKYYGLFTLIGLFLQACKAPAIGVSFAAFLGALLHYYGWYGLMFGFVAGCVLLIGYWVRGMVRRREF